MKAVALGVLFSILPNSVTFDIALFYEKIRILSHVFNCIPVGPIPN